MILPYVRVILDSSVLVAGFRSRQGASFRFIELLRAGKFQYPTHSLDQFALLLSHRCPQNELLAEPITPRSEIKSQKTKTYRVAAHTSPVWNYPFSQAEIAHNVFADI